MQDPILLNCRSCKSLKHSAKCKPCKFMNDPHQQWLTCNWSMTTKRNGNHQHSGEQDPTEWNTLPCIMQSIHSSRHVNCVLTEWQYVHENQCKRKQPANIGSFYMPLTHSPSSEDSETGLYMKIFCWSPADYWNFWGGGAAGSWKFVFGRQHLFRGAI